MIKRVKIQWQKWTLCTNKASHAWLCSCFIDINDPRIINLWWISFKEYFILNAAYFKLKFESSNIRLIGLFSWNSCMNFHFIYTFHNFLSSYSHGHIPTHEKMCQHRLFTPPLPIQTLKHRDWTCIQQIAVYQYGWP